MTLEPKLLVIEDDPQLRKLLRVSLPPNGYALIEAEAGAEGVRLAASHNPDLVILDLGLPDGDGVDVLRRIREWSRVPVIVLTARGRDEDKVTTLDAGADDYLTKPFSVPELLARIRVALRHAAAREGTGEPSVSFGDVTIDFARRVVTRAGEEVHLTPMEYSLLATLARHAGKVLTHRQLLKEVWGPNHVDQTQYLRVFMGSLRQKLEAEPARPKYLLTETGVGYRLVTD
ncbi:MAG: response regulator [Deltaproteobacteria bacterium]|nr:response regulator [Deltaproteobacteria bacterium]